ncbi:MAG: nickel-dependent lactate racemase [Caldisericia bacterium]|nr:nickel-dependent lactate racemase [Caldisericia bacterium]
MNVSLPYGRKRVFFSIPNKTNILFPQIPITKPLHDFSSKIRFLLSHPTTGIPLKSMIDTNRKQSIVIIVNDATRSTPTKKVMEVLLPFLHELGVHQNQIVIVIATGTHRQATKQEIETIVGSSVSRQYNIVCHDCDSIDLHPVGKLCTGTVLKLNPYVVNADLRLSIGEILFHYYAGFSGGRKSIFPGVADRQSIQSNHAKMLHPSSAMGCLLRNPVHEELIDSLRLCPLDFCIHLVGDTNQQIVDIVAGDPIESWKQGIQIFQKYNQISIPQKTNCLIVSAGGYPKDINMYQAHKALEMSSRAVYEGGDIIFLAECSEKWGHPVFEEYSQKNMSLEEISEQVHHHFLFGLHKLYYIAQLRTHFRLFLYSSFTEEETHLLFMEKVNHLQTYIHEMGRKKSICILPQGSIGLPMIKK